MLFCAEARYQSTSLSVLSSVLANLAHALLDAASWWDGGPASLALSLRAAMPLLPQDNRDWPQLLSSALPQDAGPRAAAQLLVLILTYLRAVAGR